MTMTTILNRATDGRPFLFLLWYVAAALVMCADPIAAALVRVWGFL